MKQLLKDNSLILMEAAIVESLRRSENIELHPVLVNAPLIYDEQGRNALGALYQKYIDIARDAKRPFMMCTPTWRADKSRVAETGIKPSINMDAVHFLQGIRDAQGSGGPPIKIGGLIGCKNDCYRPDEGLSATEAEEFHGWQLDQLKQGGVDFLIAETLPNVEEAIGISRAIERTGLPYFISFVISRDGRVLDGTDLHTAIKTIDESTGRQPLGYMINCAYPSFLNAANQPAALFERLMGYLANASSLDHCDLDGAAELQMESVSEWGGLMLELNRHYGLKVLGGCCGTNEEHLEYIAGDIRKQEDC
jgi:homocysteine S-methyltransferase